MIGDLKNVNHIAISALHALPRNPNRCDRNDKKNDIEDLSEEDFRKRYRFTKAGFIYSMPEYAEGRCPRRSGQQKISNSTRCPIASC